MSTPERGRPRFSNEVKKPKTYVVTDTAADGLRLQARRKGISVSELIERLGKGTLESETAITERLMLLLDPPIPIFWSLSAFVHRLLLQIHRKGDVEADAIVDYLKRAMTAIALINYALPELYFRDLQPLLRLLCFKMIDQDAPDFPGSADPKTISYDDGKNLDTVMKALRLARKHGSGFDVLSMSVAGRLNPLQIGRYKQITTKQIFMGNEIRMLNHEAILRVRDYTHHDYPEDPSTPPEVTGFDCPRAREYDVLAGYDVLFSDQREKLLDLLDEANRDSCLEFWVEEIDHLWGHRRLTWNTVHENSNHHDIHYLVREKLGVALFGIGDEEGYVYARHRQLSPTLETFASLDTIYAELKRSVEEELRGMPLQDVLGYVLAPLCGHYCSHRLSACEQNNTSI
jgi:hypothetical protein